MPVTSKVLQTAIVVRARQAVDNRGDSACMLSSCSLPLASPLYNLFLNNTTGMFPDGEKILYLLMLC